MTLLLYSVYWMTTAAHESNAFEPDLRVQLGSLELKNPVIVASGVFGYGQEFAELADYSQLGALVLKTITLRARRGNPPAHRTIETPGGMVNSIGLENVGLEAFLAEKLPAARRWDTHIIASIGGETIEEFVEVARGLDGAQGLSAVELNISCPNVKRGGMAFGVDAAVATDLVRAVREATRLPLIAKLTPNVTDIAQIAAACEAAGADAVSLINTFSAMVIDVHTRRPVLSANFGGLSGPAVRPAAVCRVYHAARAVRIPVIGMGGIWHADDALEFILAGAAAVAVGTALFNDPKRGNLIVEGMREFLRLEGIPSIRSLIGAVRLN